ncbi:MAG: DegT/DnrJ/EryC1/StrS family aminotransferase [Candidatus Melainabacteria bacterium]
MIPILDLTRQYQTLQQDLNTALTDVATSGAYILGPQVKRFETMAADYMGVRHAIGCANGTDALYLALRALGIGPGDEVITTPFTFIATSEMILHSGASPVFVDVDPDTYNLDVAQIEAAITPRTRAILPVHLFGQPADMTSLMALAQKHDLKVVEDTAQAMGAACNDRKAGAIGDIGTFSFFPSKNLGCMGDGGMVTTNDDTLAERLRILRAHGSKERYYHMMEGINSRLDEMQAAVLNVKLPYLDAWNNQRREVAARYNDLLKPLADRIQTPKEIAGVHAVYHQYTIRVLGATGELRSGLQKKLAEAGVQAMIYYPVPQTRQQSHAHLNLNPTDFPNTELLSREVLSLPMFPELTAGEQETVVSALQQCLPVTV